MSPELLKLLFDVVQAVIQSESNEEEILAAKQRVAEMSVEYEAALEAYRSVKRGDRSYDDDDIRRILGTVRAPD